MVDRAFYAGLSTPKARPVAIGAHVKGLPSTFVTDLSTDDLSTRPPRGDAEDMTRRPLVMSPRGKRLVENGKIGHYTYIEENCDNYLDGALLEYAVDHAMELGFEPTDTKKYTHQLVEFLMERQTRREEDPYFLWLTEVAGCLRTRVETLYDSLEHKVHNELKSHIREVAKDVAESRRSSYDAQTINDMLKSYEISGHIRLLPKVRSAKTKVMADLKQKRGCRKVVSFEDLLGLTDNPELRMALAELCAYQIMTWNQIDAKRDYKVADYRRVLEQHQNAWQRIIISLRLADGTGVTDTRYRLNSGGAAFAPNDRIRRYQADHYEDGPAYSVMMNKKPRVYGNDPYNI